MTPILQRKDEGVGRAEGGGGWNESIASKSRGREGGGGRGRGGEQQSKAIGTQTERKKIDFLSTSRMERTFYVFI